MRQRGGSLFPSVFPDHNQKQQHYPSSSTAVEAQPLLASTTTDDADIAAGRFPPSSSSAAAAATMPPTKNANAPTTSTTTSLPAAAAIVTTVENNNDNNSNTHLLLADNRQQQQQHLLPPNSNNNNNDRYNNSYDYNINDPYNNDNISNNNHLRMLQQQQQHSMNSLSSLDTAPTSACSINTMKGHPGDLEFFEDALLCPTEPVLVLGMDISDYSKSSQFVVCASGLFFFSLLYGYLQELLSVEVCGRQLGLFLALAQFSGYTVLAFVLRQFVSARHETIRKNSKSTATAMGLLAVQTGNSGDSLASHSKPQSAIKQQQQQNVPLALYLGLSLLRAVDLAMVRFYSLSLVVKRGCESKYLFCKILGFDWLGVVRTSVAAQVVVRTRRAICCYTYDWLNTFGALTPKALLLS